MAVNVRQTPVNSVVSDCKLRMVDSKKMQNGRMDVIDLRRILPIQGLVSERIARAVAYPSSNPAPAQPVREAVRVMVPSPTPLGTGHPPEFRCP
jgi:hypothetical protein